MIDKISFINIFSESFENNIISKCIISSIKKKNSENIEFKSIVIRTIETKNGRFLSWVYKYKTKDITKNYSLSDAKEILDLYIGNFFLQADLFLIDKSVHLQFLKNGESKLMTKTLDQLREINLDHNRSKKRIIDSNTAEFLVLLGVFSESGFLKKEKTDKYIQINKYIEFFAQVVKETGITNNVRVMDMGSGKGYLTFAMYHYLKEKGFADTEVQGVEYREDMVQLCNSLARKAAFSGLKFIQGQIENTEVKEIDILVALHACDTATDEAIFKGISGGAKSIMVAPCCHKEIRKQFKPVQTASLFSKFGTIEERTAESVTDLIRCLLLESQGYSVKAFEFISPDHTPKNLMITATKKQGNLKNLSKIDHVNALKNMFGIQTQYLEKLLTNSKFI
jgi:SAM-dependent methyltransferase